MASGGTFTTYNKLLPGAYINFVSVPRPTMAVGDRGIATIGIDTNWGAENELITVFSDELLSGTALPKIGYTAFDKEAKLLIAILSGCYRCEVFRTNYGGTKATASIGGLQVEALYNGKLGNELIVEVKDLQSGLFEVLTYLRGNRVDRQVVTEITELDANAYIGAFKDATGNGVLTAHAGVPLTGGTNGTVDETTAYTAYMNLLKTARFHTWAVPATDTAIKMKAAQFVEQMRDNMGRYVQCVIANFNEFDYEGVISNINTASIFGVPFTVEEFTAVITGLNAGCSINESYTEIRGGTNITPKFTESELIENTNNGFMSLTSRQDGSVVIVDDINTLHTFTIEKNREFRNNQVIRVLDEIGTSVRNIWETKYMGKVSNTENGRASFKADIIYYCNDLQRIGAIQEFAGTDDIDIRRGTELEDVICDLYIMPVMAMRKLYMTVNVRV